MNEPLQEVGEERPAPAGIRELGSKMVITLLGPNEDQLLRRFLPYAPRFNLRPARRGLPLWALPMIAAIVALLLIIPVAATIRYLTAVTIDDIEANKHEAERRLKVEAQYQAAEKRLKQVNGEKDAIDRVAGGGPRWSILLDRLREQLPPGVRLTLIKADARGRVSIEGESTDIRALGAFMVYLRAYRDERGKSFFDRPQLFSSEAFRDEGQGGTRLYRFQMMMRVPSARLADADDAPDRAGPSELQASRRSEATVSLPAPITAVATGLEGNKQIAEEAKKQLLAE